MKITLVISSLSAGGAERVLSELANYWADKGHQVSLVTLAPSTMVPFYPLHSQIDLIQLNQNANEHYSFLRRLYNIMRRVFYLRRAIKKLKPQIVISFIDVTNMVTLLASYGLKIPVIVSERIDPAYYPLPAFYKWLRLKVYPLSKKIVVQTKTVASYFPNHFKNLMVIIPNAVKQMDFVKKEIRIIKNIISVGRLDPQKDFQTLIHAFADVLKKYSELHLTIYGEGKERENLENLVRNLGISKKVSLPGTMHNIQNALSKADMFVFPSRYEGFPNALCEAMSAGLAVIASNCSGNIDVVQEGIDGRLFPVGKIEALSQLMEELIQDLPQCQYLAKNACTLSERFRPDRVLSLWDRVIEEVSKNKKL